jgi:hypothetical protein
MQIKNGNFYFPVDGHFVSEKQVRINQILQDYDKNLQLQWIPSGERSDNDMAFRVVAFPDGRAPYLVCVGQEADERLLAKVLEADQVNNPNKLSYIDNYNAALELVREKEKKEARQEDHDLAASILRSNKENYRHGGVNFERPGGRDPSKTYIWR